MTCCTLRKYCRRSRRILTSAALCVTICDVRFDKKHMHATWDCLFLSDYEAQFRKHVRRFSSIRVQMLVFLPCSERIFIAKTTHEIHISKLHISKSKNIFVPAVLVPQLTPESDICSPPSAFTSCQHWRPCQTITEITSYIATDMPQLRNGDISEEKFLIFLFFFLIFILLTSPVASLSIGLALRIALHTDCCSFRQWLPPASS